MTATEDEIAAMFAGRYTAIVRRPELGECWEFDGYRERNYGRIRQGPRLILVHRHALSLYLGRELTEKALHRCDNPPCFRPTHTYEGTMQQNMDDRAAAGHTVHGERHPKAKLTPHLVRALRDDHAAGMSLRKLAARYGICMRSAANIAHRKAWRSVL